MSADKKVAMYPFVEKQGMRGCIIPARGGSKRIKNKNIRDFCGAPIIGRAIEVARESQCFDFILVSTDCERIAKVAVDFGAWVPFTRPSELANDVAGTLPVIKHAIAWLEDNRLDIVDICCLYATSCMVEAEDIQQGLSMLQNDPDCLVMSTTSFEYPMQRALRMNNDTGKVEMLWPDFYNSRSQDLEQIYRDAGQFYWGRTSAWKTGVDMYKGSKALILPRTKAQDIDTEEDWEIAEAIFSITQSRRSRSNVSEHLTSGPEIA